MMAGPPKHTQNTHLMREEWRNEGLHFQHVTAGHNSMLTALFGHLVPGCYTNKTSPKPWKRNIKAIYTDTIVNWKEQDSPKWHSHLTGASRLTKEVRLLVQHPLKVPMHVCACVHTCT